MAISDEEKVFLRMECKTVDNRIKLQNPASVLRYQYDNHLGSACLELSDSGHTISYEEYYPFGQTSYYISSTNIEISLKRYKYCGKEPDEETGLYYYGMRYYADWLCRFVSVDPLQFKYPHYTPYQYAGNKPISYIDLDGAEEKKTDDTLYGPYVLEEVEVKPSSGNWFYNELSGDVFYHSEYIKDDAGKGNRTGEGWKWFGPKDMFGEVNNVFIENYHHLFNSNDDNYAFIWDINTYYGENKMGYEIFFSKNSEAFMGKMGHDKKPIIANVHVTETTSYHPEPHAPITITNTSERIESVAKWGYVEKGKKEKYTIIGSYSDEINSFQYFTISNITERFEIRKYEYNSNFNLSVKTETFNKLLNFGADIFQIIYEKNKNLKK